MNMFSHCDLRGAPRAPDLREEQTDVVGAAAPPLALGLKGIDHLGVGRGDESDIIGGRAALRPGGAGVRPQGIAAVLQTGRRRDPEGKAPLGVGGTQQHGAAERPHQQSPIGLYQTILADGKGEPPDRGDVDDADHLRFSLQVLQIVLARGAVVVQEGILLILKI